MQKIIFPFFLLLFTISSNAQEFIQDKTATSVDFKIKNLGFYVDGKFSDIDITCNFNSNNLSNSYIKSTIKVASINTGNNKRDEHLREADFFDVAAYENITLESIKIEKETTKKFMLTAKLTIKKTTKTVTIPLEISETSSNIHILGNFSLNRLDYGVGEDSLVLSDTVKIEIDYTGKK